MMERRRAAASLTIILAVAGCGGGDDDGHPAATATVTRAATSPATAPTATLRATLPIPSATASATLTPSATLAAPTSTHIPTATPTPRPPQITFFGVARADDLPLQPTEFDPAGRPVFMRSQGQGMIIVLEARRGVRPLERSAYDPGGSRGVDFLVSRPLGDGSPAVCDGSPPAFGGVPGIDPPVFSDQPEIVRAIDDLGCRVNDGAGAPVARLGENACTRSELTFEYGFVDASSELQYCLPIAKAWNFPVGDTIVAARIRDVAGTLSATAEIVVRVEREQPFVCDQGLGERAFEVRRASSRLLTSATGPGDASTDPWLAGVLRICAGQALGDGLYALNLREDAVLGLGLSEGGILCARISARGSSGALDCDTGSAVDVRATQDAAGATRVAVDSGLGLDAGTGAAVIRAPIAVVQLPAGALPSDCAGAVYPPPFNGALTTGEGTAQVLDADGGVLAEVRATGSSFRCDEWTSGPGGTLVLPFPAVNTPNGDRAAVLVLAE